MSLLVIPVRLLPALLVLVAMAPGCGDPGGADDERAEDTSLDSNSEETVNGHLRIRGGRNVNFEWEGDLIEGEAAIITAIMPDVPDYAPETLLIIDGDQRVRLPFISLAGNGGGACWIEQGETVLGAGPVTCQNYGRSFPAPTGTFTEMDSNRYTGFYCGVRELGETVCWRWDDEEVVEYVQDGSWGDLYLESHTEDMLCGLHGGTPECVPIDGVPWNEFQAYEVPPPVSISNAVSVSAKQEALCAVNGVGVAECSRSDHFVEDDIYDWSDVTGAGGYAFRYFYNGCGSLTETGEIVCSENGSDYRRDPMDEHGWGVFGDSGTGEVYVSYAQPRSNSAEFAATGWRVAY